MNVCLMDAFLLLRFERPGLVSARMHMRSK